MSIKMQFTKENTEYYLKELAKDFRKRGRGDCVELIIVGGASVLINYDFRNASYDIDAYYFKQSALKESISFVGDKFGLPVGWLNDDFVNTSSFTPKIRQYSQYYKTFSNVLTVRTVSAQYLVAMKLASGRQYKNDLSDIAGIVYEQQLAGNPLTYQLIDKAMQDLYGGWQNVSDTVKEVLNKILSCDDLKGLFDKLSYDESIAKETIVEIADKYPQAINESNVDEIIAIALQKKNQSEH